MKIPSKYGPVSNKSTSNFLPTVRPQFSAQLWVRHWLWR